MEKWSDLLERVSGPGDLAAVLLGGSIGFAVDAGLNVIGVLDPGVVGVTAAPSALGVKKAIEGGIQTRRKAKLARRAMDTGDWVAKLAGDGYPHLAARLDRASRALHDGMVNQEEYARIREDVAKEYIAGPIPSASAGNLP